MPSRPSRAETSPSWMTPLPESVGSSSCRAMIPPASFWYCSALRSRPARWTGLPSSVKPIAPASISSAISVSASPCRPVVTEAMKPTGTRASRRAASRSERRIGAESTVGLVFGIATTATKPPAAAERVPESRSSLCSCPGVRRCTCGSTKPGKRCLPSPSMTSTSALSRLVADLGDLAVADEHVEARVEPGARVEHVGALDQDVGGRRRTVVELAHQAGTGADLREGCGAERPASSS